VDLNNLVAGETQMATQQQIRDQITAQIVDALSKGTVPWRKPWRSDKNAGHPANSVSGKAYSGVNPLLLQLSANRHGFSSRFWATYRQWQDLGGQVMARPSKVKPGEWGTQIVFCKPCKKATEDEDGEEIRYLGDRAFYSFDGDFIQMPRREQFTVPEFYDTLFHELAGHWTEHPTRLNWDRSQPENSYAAGELRAELAACYLAGELGLPLDQNLPNHAAYLQSWLDKMKGDSRLLPEMFCLKEDETAYWDEQFRREHKIKRIFGVYVFNRRKALHVCEVTPSYERQFVGSQWEGKDGYDAEDENAAEKIDDAIREGDIGTEEWSYMHCSDVDRTLETEIKEGFLPPEGKAGGGYPITGLMSVTEDDAIEEIREWLCNGDL
jgi:antirestriction protein ArdC